MAVHINGRPYPEINWNSNGSMPDVHVKRADKIKSLKKSFFGVYEKEMGEKLSPGTEGIVVVQFAKYPVGMRIYLNPGMSHYCTGMAVIMPKPLKQQYVFESRSFWLKKGNLVPLIDGKNVLYLSAAKTAAKKIACLQKWKTHSYLGEMAIGLKAIPDFVFFPRGEKHFVSSPLVIEVKFDMSLVTEQQNAFSQVLSYARMLRCTIMGICDKERLILYKVNKYGAADRNIPLFEDHWLSIYGDSEVGARLNQLIGREVIANI